jgi:3'-5' exoribonuclease
VAGKIFIAEVRDRDRVNGLFLVQQKQVPLNKNGKPYVALVLMDRTGTMEGRIWDNVDQLESGFEAGDYVDLSGAAVAYQGRVQLKVEKIRRLEPDSVEPEDFLPASTRDRGEMVTQLKNLLQGIQKEDLRAFALSFFEDNSVRECFIHSPAAKTIHHAYLGGLLEHTLSVMELSQRIVLLYPMLDKDLLLVGAFLHDIGKIKELGRDRSFEYTDEGRLLGHIVLGATMISDQAKRFPQMSEESVMKLMHMILSHHGSYEFGSPKQPMFAEALVLNYLDDLDSKLEAFKEIAAREGGQRWSSFQKPLDRYLYLGDSSSEESSEADAVKTILVRDGKTVSEGKQPGPENAPPSAEPLDLFTPKEK